MNNGYCEKHERPYQFFCVCGNWRYECPQCRYEGVYDTIATTQTNRVDIPEATTIKVKRQIMIKAIRCIACGKWECPEYDKEKYEAEIIGEAIGLCESCRSAI